jgi:hypothetical protein
MAFQSSDMAASLTRPGQSNATGDARALYLKLFSGEMFKGFQHNAIARDLVMRRTLTNGKSLQFIYTGHTKAEYHTPGNSILGDSNGAPPVAEKTITVDDLLISSAFLYDLDETLSHYDMRSEISRKIGYALAQKYDRLIFRALTRGARAASPITKANYVEPGGTQIRVGATANASDAYNAQNLTAAFFDAAAALDEKGVSQDGRVGVLNPRQYYALIQEVGSNGLINRDEQGAASATNPGVTDPGNTGSFVSEAVEDAANDVTGINNEYGEETEFANSCGLIFQREGAGCVEAIAPQVQVTSGDVSTIYQGDVILGRLAMGADYLNPAACVELFAGTATKPAAF